MRDLDFAEAVDQILAEEKRIDRDAYFFLRDALDYTVKVRKKSRGPGVSPHVNGPELLEGIRVYAIKQFGPMVLTVFQYWNIERCEDFGHMVFQLIHARVFGKTETDSIEDFAGGYDFVEAFVTPYQPEKPARLERLQARSEETAKKDN